MRTILIFFLLIISPVGISKNYQVGIVDLSFSKVNEPIEFESIFQIASGASCTGVRPSIYVNEKTLCLKRQDPQSDSNNRNREHYAHGHYVTRNFLAEVSYQVDIYAVDILSGVSVEGMDMSIVALNLLSNLGVDMILVTTSEASFGPWGTSWKAEVDLFKEAIQRNNIILWAVDNEHISLANKRYEEKLEYPHGIEFIEEGHRLSNFRFVGASKDERIETAYPGESKVLIDHYISFNGYSHYQHEKYIFGSSFAAPKLAGIIVRNSIACDITLHSSANFIFMTNRLDSVNGVSQGIHQNDQSCP